VTVEEFQAQDAEDFCYYSVKDDWTGKDGTIRENDFTNISGQYSV